MEKITSRKNNVILLFRALLNDKSERDSKKLFISDGMKNLKEALAAHREIDTVLWKDIPGDESLCPDSRHYVLPGDLFDYVSAAANSPGPIFSVMINENVSCDGDKSVIILENVQDPGNVGTVIRTANAFKMDAVVLTGACADLYNPKTVRATMGAVFRQKVLRMNLCELKEYLNGNGLALYGAALRSDAKDIRSLSLENTAVAVGSEGRGLSEEFLNICDGTLIIPMNPMSESLNAGVAASVVMWEMNKNALE